MKKIILLLIFTIFISSCEKHCDAVCNNDGECVDGSCECPISYEGETCDDEKTPTSIYINQIVLIDYPLTNNGIPWDLLSGPDIFLSISVNNAVVYYSDVVDDTNGVVVFPINESFSNPELVHSISFFETDGFEDDTGLGGIVHELYFDDERFPEEKELRNANGLKYRISGMEYSFD